jgi:hypothetical protein
MMQPPMNITRDQLKELTELIEDSASYFCQENLISGETFWTCVECLSITKLAELRGELVYET